jgi:alpha-D-ribose 1-methylphosphonate 5-triphosphate diphosphatase
MTGSLTLTNARIILEDRVIEGSVHCEDGCLTEIGDNVPAGRETVDLEGDYLLPGFIELHTDNLEKHFAPRPGVNWPGVPAAMAHDAQLAAGGITTVFDAVCLGDLFRASNRVRQLDAMSEAIEHCQAQGVFRAEHMLHLRCELSFDGVVELFDQHVDDPLVRLISLMDHTPGQRQFVSLDKYREYYQKKYSLTDQELQAFTRKQQHAHREFSDKHRAILVDRARERGLPIASHDDATEEHVAEAAGYGAAISEFPTTLHAARAAHGRGMQVLMGAPNLVLGGSHSGNVSAMDLHQEDLLDIVSSDYVPSSLVQGVFLLTGEGGDDSLPQAVARASANPARAADLHDRGSIAIGKRADLVRVTRSTDHPVVVSVWREGRRVI